MLFAESDGNATAAIITAVGAVLLIFLNWVTNIITAYWAYQKSVVFDKKLDDNTEICKSVVPAVIVKTDSALQEAMEAKDAAERIITNASTKVGAMIGKALGDKAERHADKVAEVALKTTSQIENKIDELKHSVNGDDTGLRSRVGENTDRITRLEDEVGNIKKDVAAVKDDTAEIISLLQHRGTGI